MDKSAHVWKALGRRTDAMRLMRDCERLSQQRLRSDHLDTILSFSVLQEWEKDSI
ncbi:PFS and TPR domain-containing protein [Colletotrichum truncatum]|uniref:PFS and TPR domain-containing protein n=1 Tax=Colletotrichum truncatum TaxID=5467 RepID=A0ACC3YK84_COLTU|nr:PFS and TPR domain-containing protein [Colletotrichum truncatum]KAF6784385.1 PFS and TPR domain-containing protein [Colletotrichum truncatum]